MAGYFRKLNGYVYEGSYTAGEELENGVFAEISSGVVKKATAAGDAVFRVAEVTTMWGKNAVVLDVVDSGTKEQYMVENDFDVAGMSEYDTADQKVKAGEYVKMRRPTTGDQLILTGSGDAFKALKVGDQVTSAVGGSIAKVTSGT